MAAHSGVSQLLRQCFQPQASRLKGLPPASARQWPSGVLEAPLLAMKSLPAGQSPWPQRPSQCWRMQRSRAIGLMPAWSMQLFRLRLGSALGLALER